MVLKSSLFFKFFFQIHRVQSVKIAIISLYLTFLWSNNERSWKWEQKTHLIRITGSERCFRFSSAKTPLKVNYYFFFLVREEERKISLRSQIRSVGSVWELCQCFFFNISNDATWRNLQTIPKWIFLLLLMASSSWKRASNTYIKRSKDYQWKKVRLM